MNPRITIIILTNLLILASCSIKKRTRQSEPVLSEPITEKLVIWTEQSHINKVIRFENTMNEEKEILEKKVFLSDSVYPMFNNYRICQPYIVKRNLNSELPIYAEYFFTEKDSILKYVSYDWEKDKFGNSYKKEEMWMQESGKIEFYNEKYELIKSSLIDEFGQPNLEDSLPQITKSQWGQDDYLSRNTEWDAESMNVKLNMVFAANTYRIRLNYYWK